MNVINIEIKNKRAFRTNETSYVCGNSDFTVAFSFDEEWEAFETKTARFIYNDKHQDVVFTGSECAVPIITDTKLISVGVFAGDLHTTTPALVLANKSILCGDGVPDNPSEDVYSQIITMLNEIVKVGAQGNVETAEVFNDYKNNKAIADFTRASGSHNQSGSMAFTVISVDYANKTFTLDDTKGLDEAITKELTYSVQLSSNEKGSLYAFKFGKITAINGNVVTVDDMPSEFDGITIIELDPLNNQYGVDFEQNTFQIPELPNVGNRPIGDTSSVDGFRSWALRRYSHSWGDTNKSVAPASTTGGKDSETRGIGGVAIGIGLISCGEAQAVFGKYNVPKKEPIFILGCGTGAKNRSNALEVYPDGKVVILDESIIDYITSQENFNEYLTNIITNTVYDIKDKGALGDYIVEQGTKGIWTYRKWSNGIAECWGENSITSAVNVSSGNIFTSTTLDAVDFPFTFKVPPMVNATMGGGSFMGWIMTSGVNGSEVTTTNTGKFKIGRSTKADSGNYIINFDVKGRWK